MAGIDFEKAMAENGEAFRRYLGRLKAEPGDLVWSAMSLLTRPILTAIL